jgi:hypothetical protein
VRFDDNSVLWMEGVQDDQAFFTKNDRALYCLISCMRQEPDYQDSNRTADNHLKEPENGVH